MAIQTILLFVLAALVIRLISSGLLRLPPALKPWLLSAVNVSVIYCLQPQIPIRYLNFWMPTLTIFITVASWVLVTPPAERHWKRSLPMLLFLAAAALFMTLSRYLNINFSFLATRPPNLGQAVLGLAAAALLLALLTRFAGSNSAGTPALLSVTILILLGLFIVLKVPALAFGASRLLRAAMGQTSNLATAVDLRWLGFSYLAFRLIHTLRDRALGRLPVVGLQEYFIYVVFFPTISAGPIDRLDRFINDLRCPTPRETYWEDALQGGKRVFIGVFKKFIIADTLALISINASNIGQVVNNGWLWLLLYAYAFQIFFDFSGYSDIAIGLGRMLGIQVPENFHAPYLKPSLGQFWNNWHITLTQWIRAYYFNPLTRWLRSSKNRLPAVMVLLIGQVTTMLLIGLWHGVTLNFLIWGLWHGVGSFLENRWGIVSRPFLERISENRFARLGLSGISILLTFNYVALGWLWFALPEPGQAAHTLLRLFGLA